MKRSKRIPQRQSYETIITDFSDNDNKITTSKSLKLGNIQTTY